MMGLSNILITALLICAVSMGLLGFYGGMALTPSSGITASNLTSFYVINNITEKANNISTTFQNASASNPQSGLYVLTAPVQFIIGAAQAGMLVFDMPNLFNAMVVDVAAPMGIPSWIVGVVEAIILIIVIFAIIYFIIGRR
jgi:hypothetical protein